jgi:broad specificity phosphatase PhoE
MGQIYLVRHGQASFGAADYDQLSPTGFEQARLLGEWFADCQLPVNHVVTGTMRRHTQTATSFLSALGQEHARVEQEAGFDEYDHHEVLVRQSPALASQDRSAFGHLPPQDFQTLFAAAFERWVSGMRDSDYRVPWNAFCASAWEALNRLADRLGQGEAAVVVTSGGTITAICQKLLQLTDSRVGPFQWQIINSSVTRLRSRSGEISLSSLNGIPHLERVGNRRLVTYR